MENKPAFDRSLLIPIFIGFASVMGICLVLIAARFSALRGAIQADETRTPVKYQYVATEPGIAIPTDAPTPTAFFETETPEPTLVLFLPTITPTPILTQPPPLKITNTPATISPTPLALSIKYDDADFKFNYTGDWIGQSGVNGTSQNTLHVSNTIGDSVQLSFVGQKVQIAYQAAPSLGTIAIRLDSVDFTIDQSSSEISIEIWESPVLTLSSHTITITHISGGSINLDEVAVIDISTPTPTPTLTPTP